MPSPKIQEILNELDSLINREKKYIELVATVEYLLNLIEPSKREKFKEALYDAETVEDVHELIKAIKIQLGIQGSRKYLLTLGEQ
ncbi:MAG: hypothetical protein GXN95_02270 [Methanococci archaeon]|uniref:Uncharacterized protein n=1 Tax=Methanocaldococcus vulcanius (strain ATCC 700851 / DSM 12094 / M7) TaxID=579137 RepID=C9RI59_METVM|nr:hypothetical protein [Methanocaldococcus vulcanius]ACX73261.1 conserved hypothetical protein [Methanocaldococcus vulcanius M7]NPA62361.1 hypothetical protein [Methanococci archaeon]